MTERRTSERRELEHRLERLDNPAVADAHPGKRRRGLMGGRLARLALIAALMLGAQLSLAAPVAAQAQTSTYRLDYDQCSPLSGGGQQCVVEKSVYHTTILPDGNVEYTVSGRRCVSVRGSSIFDDFDQCERFRYSALTQDDGPQRNTYIHRFEIHVGDFDCEYNTVLIAANGQLRVDKVRRSGDCA